MQITLTIPQLKELLVDAAEIAASKAMENLGSLPPFISKAEAYRMYGRKQVDRWIAEGILKQYKDGNNTSKIRISRQNIMAVAKASNRINNISIQQ